MTAASPVIAQVESSVDEGTGRALPATDAYGNAQATNPERRSLGIYQNNVDKSYLYSYPLAGFRSSSRGSYMPFSLTGDLLSLPQWMSPQPMQPIPRDRIVTPPARREAFNRYGGFGQRIISKSQSPVFDALGRRHSLISATSLNSPLERARLNGGSSFSSGGGTAGRVSQTPFVPTDNTEIQTAAEELTVTLEQKLTDIARLSHDRAVAEGWAAFRDGMYRRAAREFQTAYSMNSGDLESHVGEVFSYVALDATHSGVAALRDLTRAVANPFTAKQDLAEHFGRPEFARQLRTSAISRVNARSTPADVVALYTFVLWYFGHADDAIQSAKAVAKAQPAFQQWPAQMEAVRADPALSPPFGTP